MCLYIASPGSLPLPSFKVLEASEISKKEVVAS